LHLRKKRKKILLYFTYLSGQVGQSNGGKRGGGGGGKIEMSSLFIFEQQSSGSWAGGTE
jgi:hypothetical protein